MWLIFTMRKPAMPPKIPVQTTTAAVSDGIPPIAAEISIAIGVVTALGASEMITSFVAPSSSAIRTTDTIPTTQPASSASSSGSICLRIFSSCR